MPTIAGIGTSWPAHKLRQGDARAYAQALFSAEHPDLLRILSVFDNSGVETRHLSRPVEWYLSPRGWRERTDAFVEVGLEVLQTAAERALDAAHVTAEEIDGIVLVTSTGISTPSLDARLANRMRLRKDLLRVPVWGLGCAGGVAGLARTADLATARPKGRFLMLSLELCSLAFLRGKIDKKMLVAASLFGDGCAAAVVEGDAVADATHPRWVGSASHQWPDTEYVMGWNVLDEGLDVVFDPVIPKFVFENVRGPLEGLAGEDAIDGYALHPGGAKVLEAFQGALSLPPHALDASREVLREHGNMSSPTALFVLQKLLDRPKPGRVLTSALGPGFSSESGLIAGAGAP